MIEEIRIKINKNQFEFSQHALNQSILRKITISEIKESMNNGEIIEEYPDDKYGASCLIFGITIKGRPLHIVTSFSQRPLIKIITLYQPSPEYWIDFKIRRINL